MIDSGALAHDTTGYFALALEVSRHLIQGQLSVLRSKCAQISRNKSDTPKDLARVFCKDPLWMGFCGRLDKC